MAVLIPFVHSDPTLAGVDDDIVADRWAALAKRLAVTDPVEVDAAGTRSFLKTLAVRMRRDAARSSRQGARCERGTGPSTPDCSPPACLVSSSTRPVPPPHQSWRPASFQSPPPPTTVKPAGCHSVISVERADPGFRPVTVEVHVEDSRYTREFPSGTGGARLTNTTSNWRAEVDDAGWRALVDLLLPPGEIAATPREDDAMRHLPDQDRRRRPA